MYQQAEPRGISRTGTRIRLALATVASVALASGVSFAYLPVEANAAAAEDYFVALGDSFMAGEGNPPYDAGTNTSDDSCHRSAQAWPRLLSSEIDTKIGEGHLACSGAVTNNIKNDGQGQEGDSQAQKLGNLVATNGKPRFVTITIGGNDAAFATTVAGCALSPVNSPLACGAALAHSQSLIDDKLDNRLKEAYQKAWEVSGHSRIFVVGYPNEVNSGVKNLALHCPTWGPLAYAQAQLLQGIADSIESHTKAAVESSRRSGIDIEYISTKDVLKGHELCTAKSWVQSTTFWNAYNHSAAHPDKQGQSAIETRVKPIFSAWLAAHPSPTPSLTPRWQLKLGETLQVGEKLTSPNGRVVFIMQTDGNVVLYADGRALWANAQNGSEPRQLEMQTDGNLVEYIINGHVPIWVSNTSNNPGTVLEVQDDGNVVLYAPGHRAIWATNTHS